MTLRGLDRKSREKLGEHQSLNYSSCGEHDGLY